MNTITMILLGATLATGTRAAPYKVFVLGGQSNMAGKGGLVSELPADMKVLPANVQIESVSLQYNLKPWVGRFGPEWAFAHEIGKAWPKEKIILIKHAIDGASLLDWAPAWDAEKAKLTQGRVAFGPVYSNALAQVRRVTANEPVEFAGVLWMQGERDARIPAAGREYAANLTALITAFRADLKSPALPFILGQINPPLQKYQAGKTVRDAQAQAAQTIPRVRLVSTEGLSKLADDLHYDTAGQLELGRRFAAAYLELVKEPAPRP